MWKILCLPPPCGGCGSCEVQIWVQVFCCVDPRCVYAIFDLKVEFESSRVSRSRTRARSSPQANGKHLHGVQNISRLIDNYNMLEIRSTNTQKLCKSKTCK